MKTFEIPSLSIFFPSCDDGPALKSLVPAAEEAARRLASDYEILVVDNGSGQETQAILKRLSEENLRLRVISHAGPLGYGGVLREGFRHAAKEWIFYTDGDGQYDPREIGRLAAQIETGAVFINGYKTSRADAWHRVLLGKFYNFGVRKIFKISLRDVDCDFRLIHRSFIQSISLSCRSGAICAELAAKAGRAGVRMAETPVSHYPRKYGKSVFFNLCAVLKTFSELRDLYLELHGRR